MMEISSEELYLKAKEFRAEKKYTEYVKNLIMACDLNHQHAIQDFLYNDDNFDIDKWNLDYQELKKFCEIRREYKFSLHYLAYIYQYGKIGEIDYKTAFDLYMQSFENGNKFTSNNIGYAYEHGRGVKQNHEKAKEYYEIGASIGCRDALHNLGYLYKYGGTVEKNPVKMLELFNAAVDKRNSYAMNSLGDLYMRGIYVKQNYETAINLFERGATLGNPRSFEFLAKIYEEYTGERDKNYILNYFLNAGKEEKLKTIYSYSDDVIEILVKNYKLEQEVKSLRVENLEMKNHILASPDGPLYFEALKQWKIDATSF